MMNERHKFPHGQKNRFTQLLNRKKSQEEESLKSSTFVDSTTLSQGLLSRSAERRPNFRVESLSSKKEELEEKDELSSLTSLSPILSNPPQSLKNLFNRRITSTTTTTTATTTTANEPENIENEKSNKNNLLDSTNIRSSEERRRQNLRAQKKNESVKTLEYVTINRRLVSTTPSTSSSYFSSSSSSLDYVTLQRGVQSSSAQYDAEFVVKENQRKNQFNSLDSSLLFLTNPELIIDDNDEETTTTTITTSLRPLKGFSISSSEQEHNHFFERQIPTNDENDSKNSFFESHNSSNLFLDSFSTESELKLETPQEGLLHELTLGTIENTEFTTEVQSIVLTESKSETSSKTHSDPLFVTSTSTISYFESLTNGFTKTKYSSFNGPSKDYQVSLERFSNATPRKLKLFSKFNSSKVPVLLNESALVENNDSTFDSETDLNSDDQLRYSNLRSNGSFSPSPFNSIETLKSKSHVIRKNNYQFRAKERTNILSENENSLSSSSPVSSLSSLRSQNTEFLKETTEKTQKNEGLRPRKGFFRAREKLNSFQSSTLSSIDYSTSASIQNQNYRLKLSRRPSLLSRGKLYEASSLNDSREIHVTEYSAKSDSLSSVSPINSLTKVSEEPSKLPRRINFVPRSRPSRFNGLSASVPKKNLSDTTIEENAPIIETSSIASTEKSQENFSTESFLPSNFDTTLIETVVTPSYFENEFRPTVLSSLVASWNENTKTILQDFVTSEPFFTFSELNSNSEFTESSTPEPENLEFSTINEGLLYILSEDVVKNTAETTVTTSVATTTLATSTTVPTTTLTTVTTTTTATTTRVTTTTTSTPTETTMVSTPSKPFSREFSLHERKKSNFKVGRENRFVTSGSNKLEGSLTSTREQFAKSSIVRRRQPQEQKQPQQVESKELVRKSEEKSSTLTSGDKVSRTNRRLSPPFPSSSSSRPLVIKSVSSHPSHSTSSSSSEDYEYYYEYEEEPKASFSFNELKVSNKNTEDNDLDYTADKSKVTMGPNGPICHDIGVFPHPESCKKFVTCSRTSIIGKINGWEYECPSYLAFDPIGGQCNWASDVSCQ